MAERASLGRIAIVKRAFDAQEIYELRKSAAREAEPDDDVPLFISDRHDEPDPDDFIHPLRPRRKSSVSFRILSVACSAATVAVVFAFLSSDATRAFVQASIAGIVPTPLAAAPSDMSLQTATPRSNPVRTAALEPARPLTPDVATANAAPPPNPANDVAHPLVAVPAVVESPTAPAVMLHHLNPGEVTAAISRADALIRSGDIAAARLVLRRPADDGDGQAAIKLAESYDPEFLSKIGAHGIVADIAMARDWYEKARQFGAEQAAQRLERLASSTR